MLSFRTTSDKLLLIAFIASVLVTLLLILFPVLHAIQLSFYQSESFVSARTWVGLANYSRVLNEPAFWRAFGVGVTFGVLTIVFQVVLGIACALLLDQPFFGRPVIRGLAILPYLLPTVVVAVAFQWLLDGSLGLFTIWAEQLGFGRPAWFENPTMAMMIVVVASVWTWTPFVTISFLAALQTIPKSLYEAARVDGAGPVRRFWHVTIPMLVPMLMVIVLLRSIWMFNKFDIIWLMTKGGPLSATEHLPVMAYRRAFMQYDVGGGAAIATLSFAVLSVLILVYFYFYPLDGKDDNA
ncbi:carbohydrate ABC transporter permease [Lacisediminimonas sp.]|uniref:carbohydrate ABC transporter permease n=1 Tax=Lacisediminimonas sp. TaxID=3060582 RepID=UPI00271EE78F|nr:sugar ABC transporter permease [Lacisediminimonas sp.]MDO8300683.1 sugar ABC transporter permease [Lacisediminimonas sp.]